MLAVVDAATAFVEVTVVVPRNHDDISISVT